MISISHWGMFRVEPYDEDLMLRHCGTVPRFAYLEVIGTELGIGYAG